MIRGYQGALVLSFAISLVGFCSFLYIHIKGIVSLSIVIIMALIIIISISYADLLFAHK